MTRLSGSPMRHAGITEWAICILALFYPLPVNGQTADPEVIVRRGVVLLVRAGQVTPINGRESLLPGDSLIGGPQAYAIVIMSTGRLSQLETDDTVAVEQRRAHRGPPRLPARILALIKSVVQPDWWDEVPVGPHRGDTAKARDTLFILYPRSGTRVLETRPDFAWSLGESSYEFELSQDGELKWRKRALESTRILEFPPDAPSLTRGRSYGWQVTDLASSQASSQGDNAQFTVASDRTRQALQDAVDHLRDDLERSGIHGPTAVLAVAGVFAERRFQYEAIQTVRAGLRTARETEELCLALHQLIGDISVAPECR